jgi:hypothetical protein
MFYFLGWLPRIKSFLNNERMETPSTFFYVFVYERILNIYFINYIYLQEKFNIIKK